MLRSQKENLRLSLAFSSHTRGARGKQMCVFCNHGTSFLEVCCGFVFQMERVRDSPASENTSPIGSRRSKPALRQRSFHLHA